MKTGKGLLAAAALLTGMVIALAAGTPDRYAYYDELFEQLYDPGHSLRIRWRDKRAYPYLQKAEQLAQAGRNDAALREFDRYLAKVPQDARMQWEKLKLLIAIKRWRPAVDTARRLTELLPDFEPARYFEAIARNESGDAAGARPLFERLLKSRQIPTRDRLYALESLYEIDYKLKDYPAALRSLEALAAIRGATPELMVRKAYLLNAMHRPAEALEIWQWVAAHARDGAQRREALENLVYLLPRARPKGQRAALLKALTRRYPQDFRACPIALQAAYLLIDAGQDEQAFEVLSRSDGTRRSCGNQYASFLSTTAMVSARLKAYPLAERFIDLLLKTDLSDEERRRWIEARGNLAFLGRDLDKALQAYKQSAALAPPEQEAAPRDKAVEVAWELGRYDEVVSLLRQAGRDDDTRLCQALMRVQRPREALDCWERRFQRQPPTVDELRVAATAAARAGDERARQLYLSRLYIKTRDPRIAMDIAYRLLKHGERQRAARWFRQIYLSHGVPEAGMQYAHLLQGGKDTGPARRFLLRLARDERLGERQRAELYDRLAFLEEQAGHHERAIRAWIQAYNLQRDPATLLHIVTAYNRLGQHDKALRIINRIDFTRLDPEQKKAWYREAGYTFYATHRLENSLEARRKLVQLEPSAVNWFNYAVTLQALGRAGEAQVAIDRATRLAPDNLTYRLNQAFIAAANGHYAAAADLLESATGGRPADPQLTENLAYLNLKAGRKEKSAALFRATLDRLDAAQQKRQAPVDTHKAALRSQLKALESRWSLAAADAACLGGSACGGGDGLATTRSGYGFGSLEADYRLTPRTLLFSRLLWGTEPDSLAVADDSAQWSVGASFRPFTQTNLLLSLEKTFPLDSARDGNWLGRVAWSRSSARAGQAARRSTPYSHLYVELAKYLQHDQQGLAFAEGRFGRRLHLGARSDLLPYVYGQGRYTERPGDDLANVELGLGLAWQLKHAFHNYYGYRATTEAYLKVGQDVYARDDDLQLRAITGLRWLYQ